MQNFDARGAVLGTAGMLLLVYALVKAPDVGWGAARTIAELAGAVGAAGRVRRSTSSGSATRWCRSRSSGSTASAAADATQLVAFAGFLAMFFFLTLYMQNVLGYSADPDRRRVPAALLRVAVSAGVSSQLLPASAPGR